MQKEVLLSVVIPVYNEFEFLRKILEKVQSINIPGVSIEMVIVDDFSTDGTREDLRKIADENKNLKVLFHDKNKGKGAALHTGFTATEGDIIIIQDADLEYDPSEYHKLLQPILDGKADVVYGSRFAGGEPHRVLFFWHYVLNNILTFFCNIFSNLNLTDMETCYKVFRKEAINSISLIEKRFGFEVEVTIKLARKKWRFYEVGISYSGRTYDEGKKIRLRDGLRAIYCIFKYGILG
ncbi:MAG: glycosyltransferase family 2 protein [Candidatus Coatesbacteria bacterium]|nr:glycosyltransferase family 2 protein [Candidatus Coatesbacteria bacterium]